MTDDPDQRRPDVPDDARAEATITTRPTTVEEAHGHAVARLAGRTNMLLRMTPEEHAELDRLAEGHEDCALVGNWPRAGRPRI